MRKPTCAAVLLTLAAFTACTQPATPVIQERNDIDRVTYKAPKVDHFTLQKKFSLTKSAKFDFKIPPHVAIPKFSGTFHASLKDAATGNASDQPGKVDFLLLTPDQYAAYQQGGSGDAIDSAMQSSSHGSSVVLSPTFNDPQTYTIIFRNNSSEPKVVAADFTADFSN